MKIGNKRSYKKSTAFREIDEAQKEGENVNTERSIWVHSRSTAVGKIKLEPAVLITTDGLGSIVISDFWKCQKTTCGCEK